MTSGSLTRAGTSNREFQQALSALRSGNLNEAERRLAAVLHAEPKHVAALNLMGVTLVQLRRFADAETYFRRALRENPNSDATHYNYGIALKALNRPAEAVQQFDEALKINSAIAETWNNRGTVRNDLEKFEEAIGDFDKAIVLNPRYAEAFYNKGKALAARGRFDDAIAANDRALALKSDLAEAWLGRGNLFYLLKRYAEALAAYDRTLTLKSDLVEGWLGCGNAFYYLGRYEEAFSAYGEALALKPDLADAWLGRGNVSRLLKRYDDAVAAFDKALALKPDLASAWLGRGNVSFNLKRHDDALAAYDRARRLQPDLAEVWLNTGNVLCELKRYDEAFAAHDKALELNPDLAEAWLGRGNVLWNLKRYDEASTAYDKAIALKPDFAEAWFGRGNVFCDLKRYDEASAAYDKAIALKPHFAEAWFGRGNVFRDLKCYREASAAYDKAIALEPHLAEAWRSRGDIFAALRQYDRAFADYDRAVALKPALPYAAGFRLFVKLHLCDWTNLDAEAARLLSMIRAGGTLSWPFTLLPISSSLTDQLQCATRYIQAQATFSPICQGEIHTHDRIRVAYLSSEFREHAVACLTIGLFEHHDRSRFEITAISTEPQSDSDFCRRIAAAFDRFVDASVQNDQEIADLVRRLEIDILVDLNGFTRSSRLGVFARRPAPIQVNYLGYAGTMGAEYYDYIIADSAVIPREHFEFYREKVAWLPDSFMANDGARPIADQTPTRRELGLPQQAFVFCCFNQSYKIESTIFDVWMRLLRAVDGSVLWLKENDATAVRNLRLEAERREVSPQRLIFAAPVPSNAEHLARQRQADLFLDTLHFNAHTTASDALWAGLPVVTCSGSTFASRVAASLLKAVGLDELITNSLEEYEALALRFASDDSLLASVKAKLAHNRDRYPLFDTPQFTRHIETAYTTMWERYRKGEAPAAFAVSRISGA
jgi:protein O-GlcNAc transferase